MADKLFNNSKFVFVGELTQGKESLTTNKLSDTSEWSRTRLNVGIKDDGNMQFLNMEYIHKDSLKTCNLFSKDGTQLEVQLNDTTKPEIIDMVSDMSKIVIDLEDDFENKKEYTKLIYKRLNHEMKKEEMNDDDKAKIKEYTEQINEMATKRITFCHIKDAISFVNQALPMIKGKKVKITGSVKCNYYKGKNNLQYVPNHIELVPEDTENQLKIFADVFYEKDSIDDDKKLKKFIVNGYLGERVKKADKLFPTTVVIDYTRVDEENEQHKMLLDFMKGFFAIKDKKQVHKIGVEIDVINGSEKIEFDESCLTPLQLMSVKLGKNKVEDFKPRGNVYGDRVVELRICNYNLRDYSNGALEIFPVSDLADYIYKDDSNVKKEDVKKEEVVQEDKKEEEPKNDMQDMMKNLFGKK